MYSDARRLIIDRDKIKPKDREESEPHERK